MKKKKEKKSKSHPKETTKMTEVSPRKEEKKGKVNRPIAAFA